MIHHVTPLQFISFAQSTVLNYIPGSGQRGQRPYPVQGHVPVDKGIPPVARRYPFIHLGRETQCPGARYMYLRHVLIGSLCCVDVSYGFTILT